MRSSLLQKDGDRGGLPLDQVDSFFTGFQSDIFRFRQYSYRHSNLYSIPQHYDQHIRGLRFSGLGNVSRKDPDSNPFGCQRVHQRAGVFGHTPGCPADSGPFSGNCGSLFACGAVHGATFGGRLPLLNVTWGDFFGRISMGSIVSFSNPFGLTANAQGPIHAASFFDIYGSYMFRFYLYVVCFGLPGALWLFIRRPMKPVRQIV